MKREIEKAFTNKIEEILTKSEGLTITEVSETIFKDVVLPAIEDEKNDWVRAMYPDKKHRQVN